MKSKERDKMKMCAGDDVSWLMWWVGLPLGEGTTRTGRAKDPAHRPSFASFHIPG